MKKTIVFTAAAILAFAGTAFSQAMGPNGLEIGKPLPGADIKMPDVSGKEVSLADSKRENGLLVIFSCNTCPYVKLSESRVKELASVTAENKVGMILLNSNEAQRNDEDSFEAMKSYAKAQGYTFSYVLDKNSAIANAFGASRTPHCFLFDKTGKLAYRGAIDDNIKDPEDVKEHYLKDAVSAVATGKPVKTNTTKSIGCTIKRAEAE